MARSTDTSSASPPIVVIHRAAELPEIASLLDGLPVDVRSHMGPLPSSEAVADASLVIVPGKRLSGSGLPNLAFWPRTLAVVDGASKTMIAHLDRLGVSVIVRRPIHPRALRLLLLHELYRGPERRQRRRTSIGFPIRVGAGLFKQRGMLLELSPTGAGLELAPIPKVGARLKLVLGRELTGSRPLKLRAQVVRVVEAPDAITGTGVVGVRLLDGRDHARTLATLLERFAQGPASWEGARPDHDPAVAEQTQPIPTEGLCGSTPTRETQAQAQQQARDTIDPEVSARRLPPTRPVEKIAQTWRAKGSVGESAPANDRRRDPRVPYDRHVVALGDEAARVLIGRDLSPGGMRIVECDHVAVGDTLRIALHCGTQMEPLVLLARALRDDGEGGFVLSFDALTANQRDHLEKIITSNASLPEIEAGGSVVLGELLEATESDDAIG